MNNYITIEYYPDILKFGGSYGGETKFNHKILQLALAIVKDLCNEIFWKSVKICFTDRVNGMQFACSVRAQSAMAIH